MDPGGSPLAVAHVSAAYDSGREAAALDLAQSLNPYPEHSCDFFDWGRGWLRETGARLARLVGRAPKPGAQPALIFPHPTLTAEQCSLLCRREGFELVHLGLGRFALVQTSAQRQITLRIAVPPDFRRERRRHPRSPGPEAA